MVMEMFSLLTVNVHILVGKLHFDFVQSHHWETLDKRYVNLSPLFFTTAFESIIISKYKV